MMKKNLLKVYLKVWLKLTAQQFEQQVANARGAALILILGKLFRFGSAYLLVYVVVGRAKLLTGYNFDQAVLVLIMFNLVQTLSQLFLRAVYLFRQKVIDGSFDFYLLNPLNELFYSLFSYTDPLDLIVLVPYITLTGWAWQNAGYALNFGSIAVVLMLILIALIFIVAWHIFIIGIGLRYLEVDNTIMLFRDIERMGAFPVDLYGRLGQFLLTYIAPFGVMATVPASYIFGNLNPLTIVLLAAISLVQLKLSVWYWRRSLLTYSSASS